MVGLDAPRPDSHRVGKGALQIGAMTAVAARRTMVHVANLAPGWGEAGLLIWRFVTLPHCPVAIATRSAQSRSTWLATRATLRHKLLPMTRSESAHL